MSWYAVRVAISHERKSKCKVRIHQALKAAGWDINKLRFPSDLGVPAFNKGSKFWSTDDFDNGLGVMINGVQHAYVMATAYAYDAAAARYCIALKYLFYDVFWSSMMTTSRSSARVRMAWGACRARLGSRRGGSCSTSMVTRHS
jgi:hypothetical protein